MQSFNSFSIYSEKNFIDSDSNNERKKPIQFCLDLTYYIKKEFHFKIKEINKKNIKGNKSYLKYY